MVGVTHELIMRDVGGSFKGEGFFTNEQTAVSAVKAEPCEFHGISYRVFIEERYDPRAALPVSMRERRLPEKLRHDEQSAAFESAGWIYSGVNEDYGLYFMRNDADSISYYADAAMPPSLSAWCGGAQTDEVSTVACASVARVNIPWPSVGRGCRWWGNWIFLLEMAETTVPDTDVLALCTRLREEDYRRFLAIRILVVVTMTRWRIILVIATTFLR